MRHLAISSGAIAKSWRLLAIRAVTILLIVLMCSGSSSAYSVLTHEEIVDLLWSDSIRPLLLIGATGTSTPRVWFRSGWTRRPAQFGSVFGTKRSTWAEGEARVNDRPATLHSSQEVNRASIAGLSDCCEYSVGRTDTEKSC